MADAPNASDPNESSVVFNLRQLMQLESERIAAEAAAVRAAAARVAQARADREREQRAAVARDALAAQAREQQQREAEQQRTLQHQAALARIRADAAARERVESQRATLEHERALRRLHNEGRASRALHVVCLLCALVGCAGVVGYVLVVRPSLQAARSRALHAEALRAAQAQALRDALAEVANARTAVRVAAASSAVAPVRATEITPGAQRNKTKPATRPARVVHKPPPIPELELPDGDDPLGGLPGVDDADVHATRLNKHR